MADPKFTPGPWETDAPYDFVTQVWGRGGKVQVADLDIPGDSLCSEEQEANAHLIAAAPELYEALEDALAVLRVYQNDGAVVSHRGQGIGVICDEALALARGEVKP